MYYPGFPQVLEILESHEISYLVFQGLESAWILLWDLEFPKKSWNLILSNKKKMKEKKSSQTVKQKYPLKSDMPW